MIRRRRRKDHKAIIKYLLRDPLDQYSDWPCNKCDFSLEVTISYSSNVQNLNLAYCEILWISGARLGEKDRPDGGGAQRSLQQVRESSQLKSVGFHWFPTGKTWRGSSSLSRSSRGPFCIPTTTFFSLPGEVKIYMRGGMQFYRRSKNIWVSLFGGIYRDTLSLPEMQNPTSPGATTRFFQMMIWLVWCDTVFFQAQLLVLVDNLVVSCDVNLFFFFRRNY